MVEGSAATTYYAISVLRPDKDSGVSGTVKFIQVEGKPVFIKSELKGLKPGKHGFHIHEFGKYTN